MDLNLINDIDQLNEALWKWLGDDYNEKVHTAISDTPLNIFLSQSESINMPTDLSTFNEKFLVSVPRTVKHDATLSLNSTLYETGQEFCGRKLNVKYDPELIPQGLNEVFLYDGDKCVGLAKRVNFSDNAKMKRKGRASSRTKSEVSTQISTDSSIPKTIEERSPISFFDLENI